MHEKMTVPVLTEENKVSLIVKGDDATPAVIGVGVEEAGQHATHTVTQASVEVVEDHLRPMAGHLVCPLRHSTSTTAQHPQFVKQNTSTRYKQHHNTDTLSLSLTHTHACHCQIVRKKKPTYGCKINNMDLHID